jgi:predicted PurR-regulated permease PerM
METIKASTSSRSQVKTNGTGKLPRVPMLAKITWLIVSAAGVLLLFYCARSVVLPVLLAWVGSMVLHPPVSWLRQHHVPAPLGSALVLILLGAVLGFGLIQFGRPVADWVNSAPETLPRLREKYQRLFKPLSRLTDAVYGVDGNSHDNSHHRTDAGPSSAAGNLAGTLFSWTGTVLAGVVETVVLMFLVLASGDRFTRKLACVFQVLSNKVDALEICRQIEQSVSKYLFSVSIINVVLGIAVGTTLQLCGMPNAAMWGAVATVINFVPYFGPVMGIAAVACAGLLAFDTFTRGLLPAGCYLCWHIFEADLVTPMLLGRRFKMNAIVIFVMLMFCAWLWGVLGTLLAMPLLLTINVICSRVRSGAVLAEFLSA